MLIFSAATVISSGLVGVNLLSGMTAEEVHERGESVLKILALESRDVLDVRRDVVDEQPHLLALDAPRALCLPTMMWSDQSRSANFSALMSRRSGSRRRAGAMDILACLQMSHSLHLGK